MLYTALCGEILELKPCLAEPGPDLRPTPQIKSFTLPSVVKSWDQIPAKQMLYSALCGEILGLNSCLAEPWPDPRPAP
jgi:hypothetical protein